MLHVCSADTETLRLGAHVLVLLVTPAAAAAAESCSTHQPCNAYKSVQ